MVYKMNNHLINYPEGILVDILKNLTNQDLLRLCPWNYKLCGNENLWEELSIFEFGVHHKLANTWLETYNFLSRYGQWAEILKIFKEGDPEIWNAIPILKYHTHYVNREGHDEEIVPIKYIVLRYERIPRDKDKYLIGLTDGKFYPSQIVELSETKLVTEDWFAFDRDNLFTYNYDVANIEPIYWALLRADVDYYLEDMKFPSVPKIDPRKELSKYMKIMGFSKDTDPIYLAQELAQRLLEDGYYPSQITQILSLIKK